MYKRILVAVDVAELDIMPPGVAAAIEMAGMTDGAVRLINVRSPVPLSQAEFMMPEFFVESQQKALAELQAFAKNFESLKGGVSALCRLGPVYAEVLQEAKDWDADLIIVSSHQPSMATYLLGSNAAKIVRHAECTVLVVRAGKKQSLFA